MDYKTASKEKQIQMATRRAWDIIQLLERPGDEIPGLREIREACRSARELTMLCETLDRLASWPGDLELEHDDQELENHSPFLY